MNCGTCKFWKTYGSYEEAGEGECARVGRLVLDTTKPVSLFDNGARFIWEPANSPFRVETGENYCDGELITHRDFGCKAFEEGSYDWENG